MPDVPQRGSEHGSRRTPIVIGRDLAAPSEESNQTTTSEDYNRLRLSVCYSDLCSLQINDSVIIICNYEFTSVQYNPRVYSLTRDSIK
jgi:hypothetical protein